MITKIVWPTIKSQHRSKSEADNLYIEEIKKIISSSNGD